LKESQALISELYEKIEKTEEKVRNLLDEVETYQELVKIMKT
jgi:uncharacterized protein YlxW (UPF0749 family)